MDFTLSFACVFLAFLALSSPSAGANIRYMLTSSGDKVPMLTKSSNRTPRKNIVVSKSLMFIPKNVSLVEEMTVPYLGTLKISCGANAVPAPTIHWLKDNQRVYQNPTIDELVANEESSYQEGILFTISNSVYTEDCMQYDTVYTCVANTITDKIARVIKVRIDPQVEGATIPEKCLGKLSQDPLEDEVLGVRKERNIDMDENLTTLPERPQIYMWTSFVRAYLGIPLQVYCRAKGIHPSEITWSIKAITKNAQYVPLTLENAEEYGFRQLPNGDLKTESLTRPSRGWRGMYNLKCTAGSDIWGDSKEISVSIAARSKRRGN